MLLNFSERSTELAFVATAFAKYILYTYKTIWPRLYVVKEGVLNFRIISLDFTQYDIIRPILIVIIIYNYIWHRVQNVHKLKTNVHITNLQ